MFVVLRTTTAPVRFDSIDTLRWWLLKGRRWDRAHRAQERRDTDTWSLVCPEDETVRPGESVALHTLFLLQQAVRLSQLDSRTRVLFAVQHGRRLDLTAEEEERERAEVERRVSNCHAIEYENILMGIILPQLRLLPLLLEQEALPADYAPLRPPCEALALLHDWVHREGLDGWPSAPPLPPADQRTPSASRLCAWLERPATLLRGWLRRWEEMRPQSGPAELLQDWDLCRDMATGIVHVADAVCRSRTKRRLPHEEG